MGMSSPFKPRELSGICFQDQSINYSITSALLYFAGIASVTRRTDFYAWASKTLMFAGGGEGT